ncbi:MAG: aldo/keto reductase, partial [Planctomycetota bacterium]
MKYRRLGDTGMMISEVGLGGWLTFGNALGNDAAREVMDAAFDTGVTFLDNADVYARGECETV